ncbi:response regulator [Roseateles sp. 22389]|uniref:response regulator n=1 Tax=Roseateles sp. 22389 TaxID=3453916 RepID=UPI003F865850
MERPPLEGKVVLIVEDNADVRDASSQLLSAEGLAVRVVEDAPQALALLDGGFAADCLVSDIVMPGAMDGVELVRIVKVRFPAIRTVLVTGYSDIAERAREEGFTVLRKPYDLASLMEALS